MDFSFTEEQDLLRNSLSSFLRDNYTFESRYAASMTEQGWQPEIWQSLATELGILGLSLPERVGGFGGDAVSTMVVMEELGRALVVEPYLETIVICAGLLAKAGGELADEVLSQVASGEQLLAFAWAEPQTRYDFKAISTTAKQCGEHWQINGSKSVVKAAPWASKIIVAARTSGAVGDAEGLSLFLVDKDTVGVEVSDYPTVDGRRASDIILKSVSVSKNALIGVEGQALSIIEQVNDEAIAALCAESLGVMSKLHEDTIEYTKQRKQFGQPLSNFQVLQHRMVDMYMHIELSISATYLATLKVGADSIERTMAASTAKVTVNKACKFVGQNAVQLHGGMGMSDELAVSHYFKRATLIETEFGSTDFHLTKYADLSLSV